VANVRLLRSFAPGARLLAAVKADAYGHGLLPVARALADAGVDAFGVATADEALALRARRGRGLVLLFGPVRAGIAALVAADVALTVADPASLAADRGRRGAGPARVHVKVDTGMGRLGLPPAAARALVARRRPLARRPTSRASGPTSRRPTSPAPTRARLGDGPALAGVRATSSTALARDGLRPPWAHAANSAALIARPDAAFDMVRPGIAVYGQPPSAHRAAGARPPARAARSTRRSRS
jgi:alanine racemase